MMPFKNTCEGHNEPDALRAEVASAEPSLVELHACVCTFISVHLHNQNKNDYLNISTAVLGLYSEQVCK